MSSRCDFYDWSKRNFPTERFISGVDTLTPGVLPSNLEQLTLGTFFNQPLTRAVLTLTIPSQFRVMYCLFI